MTGPPSTPPPTRRSMLALLAGAGAAAALGGACTPGDAFPAVTRIGDAYLTRTPGEASVATLTGLLGGVPPATTPAVLLADLDGAVRSDFTTGDTVWIAGWLLSRTEARIAALWALQH